MTKVAGRPTQKNRPHYYQNSQTLQYLWRKFIARPDALQVLNGASNSGLLPEDVKETIRDIMIPNYFARDRVGYRGAEMNRVVKALILIDEALSISQADVKLIIDNPAALETMKVPPELAEMRARLVKLAREYDRGLHGDKGRRTTEFEIRYLLSKGSDGKAVIARLEEFLKTNPEARDPTAAERAKAYGILASKTFARTTEAVDTLRSLVKLDASADGLTPAQRARAKKLVELFDKQKSAVGSQKIFAVLELERFLKDPLTTTLVDTIVPEIKRTADTSRFEKMLKLVDLMMALKPEDWARYRITDARGKMVAKLLPLLLRAKGKSGAERAVIEAEFNRLFDSNFRASYLLGETLSKFAKVVDSDVYKNVDKVLDMLKLPSKDLKLHKNNNPLPPATVALLQNFKYLKYRLRNAKGADRLHILSEMRKLLLTSTAKAVAKIPTSDLTGKIADARVILKNLESLTALLNSGTLSAEEKEAVQQLVNKVKAYDWLSTDPLHLESKVKLLVIDLAGNKFSNKVADFLRGLETYKEAQGDRKVDSLDDATDLLKRSEDVLLRDAGRLIEEMKSAKSAVTKNLYRMLASKKINNLGLSQNANRIIESLAVLDDGALSLFLQVNSTIPEYAALKILLDKYGNGSATAQEVVAALAAFRYDGKQGLEAIKSAKNALFQDMLSQYKTGGPGKFDGIRAITDLNKDGVKYTYYDSEKQKVVEFTGKLADLLSTLLVKRLSGADKTIVTKDGDTLTAKEYVELLELKSMAEAGWTLGYEHFGSGSSFANNWRGNWDGTIPAQWMADNIIDKEEVLARLNKYENSSEFAAFLRGEQAAIKLEQKNHLPAFVDPQNVLDFASILQGKDFAKWMSEKDASGKQYEDRSELATAILGAINSLDPELAKKTLNQMTANQLTVQADLAFAAPPTETQLRETTNKVAEIFKHIFDNGEQVAPFLGSLGATDWKKFKAVLASFVSKRAWERGETLQTVMAEFDKQMALQGADGRQQAKFRAIFQDHWRRGTFHTYIAGPVSMVAGIWGLVEGKNDWERLDAAGHLLNFVSWSQFYAQTVAYNKTRPNSTSILSMVSADRGVLGNRLLANMPEWLKLSKKYKQSASATAINNSISNIASIALNFGSTISAAAEMDMSEIIKTFVSNGRKLDLAEKRLAALEARLDSEPQNAPPERLAALKQRIEALKTRIASLYTEIDSPGGLKEALAKMGMLEVKNGGAIVASADGQNKINAFYDSLRGKLDQKKHSLVLVKEITDAINIKRLEVIESNLVRAGMVPGSREVESLAKLLLTREGSAAFDRDRRAFLLSEISRSSLNAGTVAQYDKVKAALAGWNAKEILAGVKTVDGKVLKIDDALKAAGLNFTERTGVITTLELTAAKWLNDSPTLIDQSMFTVLESDLKDALKGWTFSNLRNEAWTDADGRTWTLEEWLRNKGLGKEALDTVRARVGDVERDGVPDDPDWRYNKNMSSYFDILNDLDDPAASLRIAGQIDDVRRAKLEYWYNETYRLIRDTKVSDLKNGNVDIGGAGAERLTSLRSQLIAAGMTGADADIMETRIRLVAAAETDQTQTVSGWGDQNALGQDVITKKWADFASLSDPDKQTILNGFSDDFTKGQLDKFAKKSFNFDTKLQADKLAALLSTSDLSGQSKIDISVNKKLMTGAVFRNVLEGLGLVASVVDVVLGVKDLVDGINKQQGLLAASGGVSVVAGLVGLAGGLAVFQTGAVFALALPLTIAATVLGVVAMGLAMGFMAGKQKKQVRKAYEDALKKYSSTYMKDGWHDRMKKMIKDIADGNYINIPASP